MFSELIILINQVAEAGIAITALSLFFRALSFNLKNRVTRSFTIILACVVVVYSGEAIGASVETVNGLEFWLKFQWLGLIFFPTAYVHFSDALLETTGLPSRGRRRNVVRSGYIISGLLVATIPFGVMHGNVTTENVPFAYLSPTPLSQFFAIYYLAAIIIAATWMWRAFKRTKILLSRRRLGYLQAGALLLAIGTYPYIQLSFWFVGQIPILFSLIVVLANMSVFWFLVLMAYAVGFFGVVWPDRVIRSRLLKWLLRGPVTLFIVLTLMTIVHQIGIYFGDEYSVAVPIVTVTSVLIFEHLITLIYPTIERWLFHGDDREILGGLQELQDRLVSNSDLNQFFEAILASVCDKFQIETAFIAVFDDGLTNSLVQVGDATLLENMQLSATSLIEATIQNEEIKIFEWGEFWLYPLYGLADEGNETMLGLLGIYKTVVNWSDEDIVETLSILGERASLALEDWRLQQQIFKSIQSLSPKVEVIQRLRAAARYDQQEIFTSSKSSIESQDLSRWVKDALSHYWGGPKLTENPLLKLKVVQEALVEHEGNSVNALRGILRSAVNDVKPRGERRFTGEWILYNILEMKFMEGRKVRDIALRLAMSEADLYRKQRVAIEEVAKKIVDKERAARAS